MKLIRFGLPGQEKPGILDSNEVRRDLSSQFRDWDFDFWESRGADKLQAMLTAGTAQLPVVPESERWGAPVSRPGKVICIGLNYSDHARESGMPVPAEPVVFLKASNTVVGPYDDIEIPRGSSKTDWEVELGVVIGRNTRYLSSVDEARNAIGGYVLTHDVSERAFQLERGGQWTKGKSCDTFNPLGPFVVTPDELPDPSHLDMYLDVNSVRRQSGTTATMVFHVYTIIHYLSQFMTLEAGDLISTGTPPGVGLGMKPPQYLKPGDVVELGIENLGRQRQKCVAAR